MARTVRDAAILLGICTGVDEADSYTAASKGKAKPDYTIFCDANGLQGKRIGIEKEALKTNSYLDAVFADAINLLKSKGATIVEVELYKAIETGRS